MTLTAFLTDYLIVDTGGIYHCAEFGWNRCCSFDKVDVLMFCVFGLKAKHANSLPENVFLGVSTP